MAFLHYGAFELCTSLACKAGGWLFLFLRKMLWYLWLGSSMQKLIFSSLHRKEITNSERLLIEANWEMGQKRH